MSYTIASGNRSGTFVSTTTETVKAAATETSSTSGSSTELGHKDRLLVSVAVTAASGTSPTMTVVIEGSEDGSTWVGLCTIGSNGYAVGSVTSAPANITTTGTYLGFCDVLHYMRARSVIGGTTPSFTYSVTATAYDR